MNIQLKNVKISKNLSRETVAFTATLYIDNKSYGEVMNDGQGGCHYLDRQAEKLLTEHAKTLPKWKGEYDPSFETIIDDLVETHDLQQDLKRRLSTRLIGVNADGKLIESKTISKAHLAIYVASPEKTAKFSSVLLNRMPFEEAFKMFKAQVSPE